MIRPDYRIVVRPRLSVAAVQEAQFAADARGVPLADYLGDLVADRLPDALAELARLKLDRMGRLAAEALVDGVDVSDPRWVEMPRPTAEAGVADVCSDGSHLVGSTLTCDDAPGIPAQGISDEFVPPASSTPSIPASASEQGPVAGAPAI
jgi:hypothetical protein